MAIKKIGVFFNFDYNILWRFNEDLTRDYLKVIVALLVIIVMSFIFLNVVIPANDSSDSENVNTGPSEITIHPTGEVGKGVQTLQDNNQGYIAMITDESGQTYYFVNRSTVLRWYNQTNGNYSAPFKVIYFNGTVNGDNNSRIISRVL